MAKKPEDGLGVVIALGKPKGSKGETAASEPDGDDAGGGTRELAARALIAAIKASDASGVADALDEFLAGQSSSKGEPDGDEY